MFTQDTHRARRRLARDRRLAAVSRRRSQAARHHAHRRRRREGRQQGRHHSRVHRRPEGRPGVVQEGQRHPSVAVREREAAPRHRQQERRAARGQADGGHEGAPQALSEHDAPRRVSDASRGRAAAQGARQHREERDRHQERQRRARRRRHASRRPVPDPEERLRGDVEPPRALHRASPTTTKYENWNVDAAGVPSLATAGNLINEFPLYDPKRADTPAKDTDPYWKLKVSYTGPARRAGEALMVDRLGQRRSRSRAAPGNTCPASAA